MNNTLKTPKINDYINLFALSSIWGTAFIGIEIAIEHLNIFHVTFGRVFISFLFLIPLQSLLTQKQVSCSTQECHT